MNSEQRLKEILRALGASFRKGKTPPPSPAPGCPFGLAVEERLKNLERNLQETRTRVNALIFLVLTAVLEQIVLRLLV